MRIRWLLPFIFLTLCGCDRIYGLLHKPGGEEREILGAVIFNEYNPKVEELQKIFRLFGYTLGRTDGKFGASTRETVAKFQTEEGLPVTRFVDKATWGRIQEYVQSPFVHKLEINVKALQTALRKAGFFYGKVDGSLGPQTRAAVKEFQRANNLNADGLIGLKTIKALLSYVMEKGTADPQGNATPSPGASR
jgi:peptidoglycan hydrolase-like protein with peptidoglycan-binding domain